MIRIEVMDEKTTQDDDGVLGILDGLFEARGFIMKVAARESRA